MKKIAFGRQQGTYHVSSGLPCQDYVSGTFKDSTYAMALADGAGSYPNSEIAAEAVVNAVILSFVSQFDYWYYMPEESFKEMLLQLCRESVAESDPDLVAYCTLLLYVAHEDEREIIVHIGDGYIFGLDYSDDISVISYPENGDEPNQTFFLSDKSAIDHLRIIRNELSENAGVMICSDGAATSLIDRSAERYAAAIRKLIMTADYASEEEASEIITKTLDAMFRTHSSDDMSIGIMVNCYSDEND